MRFRTRRTRRRSRSFQKIPPGIRPGLKESKPSEIANCCNPITDSDYFEPIHEDHWEELCNTDAHKAKEKRYRFTLNQGSVGSCGNECCGSAGGACDTKRNPSKPAIITNPYFGYNKTSGGVDRGSSILANVEDTVRRGRCPEEVRPRSKGWRAAPTAEELRVAKLFTLREYFSVDRVSDLISALLQGFEAVAGYMGHAIAFTRVYYRQGKLKYKNSWGDWGEDGFGYLPINDIYLPYGIFVFQATIALDETKWQPTMDQERLAIAASSFEDEMRARVVRGERPWDARRQDWRDELYQRHLEKCGLAS